jgi:RNA polymerase sigma-70 factor (ECF subfamily)
MVTWTDDLGDALARAQSGDDAGFLELWRQLQPRLLRYLRVLNCSDADDVASETWLQVVRDLPTFRGGDEDFRRWLFTVGRHRAIDDARARLRRPTIPMPDTIAGVADDDVVEDQVLHALSVKQAVTLLGALPADQADAVALRVLAGLDTGRSLASSANPPARSESRCTGDSAPSRASRPCKRWPAATRGPARRSPQAGARTRALRRLAAPGRRTCEAGSTR